MRTLALLLIPALASLLAACASSEEAPDLAGLYDRAAQSEDDLRNPVIVIPGILGTRLRDGPGGRIVWGAYGGDFADPETPDGARLVALPMREGAPLAELRDNAVTDGVLDRLEVRFAGLPIELDAYRQILRTLGIGGYRDQQLAEAGVVNYGPLHYTCFQFAYDWRRDCVENARLLGEFIETRRAYVQEQRRKKFGDNCPEVKVDIVAHSMGGLILRYYLMYGGAEPPEGGSTPVPTWAGAAHVGRAILVGTPSNGSVIALTQLVNGTQHAAFLPKYEPAILGTHVSIYELLPRTAEARIRTRDESHTAVDLFDVATWERYRWGLADPDQDDTLAMLLPDVADPAARRRIALDQLAKSLARAKAFHRALDAESAPPPGTTIHLIAGDAQATPASLTVDPAGGRLRIDGKTPGDGTVTRASALADGRTTDTWQRTLRSPISWSSVTFLPHDHVGITANPVFTDNLLYMLLEAQR